MSQALATVSAPRAVAGLSTGTVAAIVPTTFDEVYRFAQVVSASGLAPDTMKSPEQVTIAILTGLEIGVKPMQAIQGIAVIGKRPCIWGDLALAVVRASGVIEFIQERFEGDEPPDIKNVKPTERGYRAICTIKRKGEPEAVSEFSIQDAVTGGLWLKAGPWTTSPKRMLRMRARGFALRDNCADVLKGMVLAEEMIGNEESMGDARPARKSKGPPPAPAANDTEQRPAETIVDAEHTEVVSQSSASPEVANQEISIEDHKAHYEGLAEPEDAVDLAETLAALTEKLAHAATIEQLEEMYDDFGAEEVLAEIEGGAVAARKVKDAALARIQNALQATRSTTPAPTSAEVGADPFAVPTNVTTVDGYRQHIQIAMQSVSDETSAKELSALWNGTKALRGELDVPEPTTRELKAAVTRVVSKFKPKATAEPDTLAEPAPEPRPVDLDAVPTTKAEYLALVAARAALTDFDRVRDFKRFWGREQELRESLGLTEAEYTPAKRALWARVDELRPDEEV